MAKAAKVTPAMTSIGTRAGWIGRTPCRSRSRSVLDRGPTLIALRPSWYLSPAPIYGTLSEGPPVSTRDREVMGIAEVGVPTTSSTGAWWRILLLGLGLFVLAVFLFAMTGNPNLF